jgi:steroid delta-isomerase-like uncharacterized protein
MTTQATHVVEQYYQAFNKQDMDAFFSLLDEQVIHEINHGTTETGKQAFVRFMEHMNRCYQEKVVDLVIFSSRQPDRAAAEFFIEGKYLATDPGLPDARGQTYRLRVGAFFEVRDGKVSRVTNYYNLKEWLAQIK